VSVQSALKFIQHIRGDQELRDALAALGPEPAMALLLTAGPAAGFGFTEAELRQAFKHDWAMRRLHQSAASEPHGQGTEPPKL
jgi:predicted ribosomally synthesized peptide with nif11-like leader